MKKAILLCMIIFLAAGAINAQEKITMAVNDLNSNIEKYIKKTYPEHKATEAFKYAMVYGVKIQKGDSVLGLVFNQNAKFLSIYTPADKEKYALQTRATMSLDDVSGDITKYVKKNHEGFKMTEAYTFDEVYVVKVMKGNENEMLLFDKDGKFVRKVTAAKPAAPAAISDTGAVMKEAQPEPMKTDSIKN